MNNPETNPENVVQQRMAEEEKLRHKVDKDGIHWTKIYFGGGAHFQNWLDQTIELRGKENVMVEEADSRGFKCFEEGGEKRYRIWVKDTDAKTDND
jgi:hypothetical protein